MVAACITSVYVGHNAKDPRVKDTGLRCKYLLAMQKRRTSGEPMAGADVTPIAHIAPRTNECPGVLSPTQTH
jgi:hypothetical protein